jgi:membrane protein implicated in regulation of membrane protease activity
VRLFLHHLLIFAVGAAAAIGAISAIYAATANLQLAFALAFCGSVLLAFVAFSAERATLTRQRKLQQELSRGGGHHEPDFVILSLDELPVWEPFRGHTPGA